MLILCLSVGKTLAYTSTKFINNKDEIVARGSHTKFVALAYKDEKNIVDQLKPELPETKEFK
jgi:acyl-coenzyme A thioesterase 13